MAEPAHAGRKLTAAVHGIKGWSLSPDGAGCIQAEGGSLPVVEREDFLDGCINAVTTAFVVGFGFDWLSILEAIFMYQQTFNPDYTDAGFLDREVPALMVVAFALLSLPAGSWKRLEEYAVEDWRLFPNKIILMIIIAAAAGVILYRLPNLGKVRETAVLSAVWPLFLIGLLVLWFIQRLLLGIFFWMKDFPTVTSKPKGRAETVITLIELFAGIPVVWTIRLLPLERIPSFIY